MSAESQFLTVDIVNEISSELQLGRSQVQNTLELLLSDCTVPFIARYRKEATNGLDEVAIRNVRDKYDYIVTLNERREAVLKSIDEQGKLTPVLREKIVKCRSKTDLEDLYLPYKPKKRTRGQIARERGLELLSHRLLKGEALGGTLREVATALVGSHVDLTTVEIVLQGCKDLVAETIAETPEVRGEIRQWTFDFASFRSEVRDEFKEKKTKYNNYFDFAEPVKTIAPHRLMALRRGEKEDVLRVSLDFDSKLPLSLIEKRVLVDSMSDEVRSFVVDCARDAYTRLISTGVETELRLETKSRAEEEAIRVFAKNLRNLLLLPPIPKKMVLGVDPGIRTGSKLVVVDQTGKLIEYVTIYPDHEVPPTAPRNQNALEKLADLIERHKIECVSIGNGTAGREMEAFVEHCVETRFAGKVQVLVVSESGASVYSASDVAREEFPDLDISYRGAVCIARRLQDPLAELVKIDPKSIGVGQYQHDVNQVKLKRSLEEVVESCVNYVGVNLNTASPSLLSYVSGIGPALARNIVEHRNGKGEFCERRQLLDIAGFGPKTFEQAAGFLRIPESPNPLDNSAVHPESYGLVEKMAQSVGLTVRDLVGNKESLKKLNLNEFATESFGMFTLQDIVSELSKPGRDPREEGVKHTYSKHVRSFEQLVEGEVLVGTVTNVTNFGAFVDIGVHQDGLVHISELCNGFVKNPAEVISVGEQVRVKVIGVDRERKRISLSRRAAEEGGAKAPAAVLTPVVSQRVPAQSGASAAAKGSASSLTVGPRPATRAGAMREDQGKRDNRGGKRERPEANAEQRAPASMEELLSKFNNRRL